MARGTRKMVSEELVKDKKEMEELHGLTVEFWRVDQPSIDWMVSESKAATRELRERLTIIIPKGWKPVALSSPQTISVGELTMTRVHLGEAMVFNLTLKILAPRRAQEELNEQS